MRSTHANRRRSSRRWGWRALVCACAVFALLSDVWRAAHWFAVRHVTCAHDGALVHEDEHYHPAEAGGAARHVSTIRGESVSAGGAHEHEHCGLRGAAQRCAGALFAERVAVIGATGSTSSAPCGPSQTDSRRDVLTYAPRLPPPA